MSFCPKCGQPTEEAQAFCQACGCALTQAEPAAEPPAEEQLPAKKPFSKKKLAVALGSAAVVLVAIIAAVALFFEPILQTVMPAGTYLRRVGKAKAAMLAADVGAMVDEQASVQGEEAAAECAIELRLGTGQKAKDLIKKLQTALGLDLSGFEKFSLSLRTQQKDDAQQAKAELLINDARQFTALCQTDLAAGSLLLYLPDLNRQPLHLDMTELTRLFAGSAVLMPQEGLTTEILPADLFEELPDGKTLENILVRVLAAAIDTIQDAKKESVTLTADGVSQKGSAYTVELTDNLLIRAGETVLQTVRDDPDVRQLLETAQEGTYDAFVEEIDKALAELKKGPPAGEENSLAGTMVSVFVDKKGDVRGLWVEREETTVFSLACPEDGDRFGLLLDVPGAVKVSGSGEKDGENRSGTFTLSWYETTGDGAQQEIPALTVRIEDLCWEPDVQKGSVAVEPSKQLLDKLELSEQLAALGLTKPALCLSLDCELARQNLTLSVQDDGEELAALSVGTHPGKPFEDAIPGNAAKIADLEDAINWLAGCEGELGEMLQQLVAMAMGGFFEQMT